MSNKIIIPKGKITCWELQIGEIYRFRVDVEVSNKKTVRDLSEKLKDGKLLFKITLEDLETLQNLNENFLSKSDKKKFKIINDLSRAAGLAKGALYGVKEFEDYSKEGLIKILQEIDELIQKSLKEIENEKN